MTEFTAASTFIPEGVHEVEIISIKERVSKANPEFADITPLLEIKFKTSDNKTASKWQGLKGYCTFDELPTEKLISGNYEPRGDKGFAVEISTKKRVENVLKTNYLISRISQLGFICGIPKNEMFTLNDLIGKKIQIVVGIDMMNRLTVTDTLPLNKSILGADESQEIIPAGINLVKIKDIRYALKPNSPSILKTTKAGKCAITFTFEDVKGKTISTDFWLTENSKWIFKKLCKAIDIDYNTIDYLFEDGDIEIVEKNKYEVAKSIAIKNCEAALRGVYISNPHNDRTILNRVFQEAIGKYLIIIVAEYYWLVNGKRQLGIMDNKEIFQLVVPPEFYKVHDPFLPPAIIGDPKNNGGICSGKFLIEKGNDNYEDDNYSTDDFDDGFWSCDICEGNQSTGCLYFDPTECPRA